MARRGRAGQGAAGRAGSGGAELAACAHVIAYAIASALGNALTIACVFADALADSPADGHAHVIFFADVIAGGLAFTHAPRKPALPLPSPYHCPPARGPGRGSPRGPESC